MPESLIIGDVNLMSERAIKAPLSMVDFSSTMVAVTSEEEPTQAPTSYRPARDSSWLQVDVCRDFQRDTCPRGFTCRFAHIKSRAILVKEGKVTCCYDYLKDRCQRPQCKYYHPPVHIKEKLVCAGKQFGAMMSTVSPILPPTGMVTTTAAACHSESVATASYAPDTVAASYNRIPLCPEFLMGYCSIVMCPFAHPGPCVRHNKDYTVTVCQNFMNYGCPRGEGCRFYHPLSHQLWGPVLHLNGGLYQLGQAVPGNIDPYVSGPSPMPVMYPMAIPPFPFPGMPTSPVMQVAGSGFMPASSGFMPLPANGGVMSFPSPVWSPPQSLPYVPPPQTYSPPTQPAGNVMENSDTVLESEE